MTFLFSEMRYRLSSTQQHKLKKSTKRKKLSLNKLNINSNLAARLTNNTIHLVLNNFIFNRHKLLHILSLFYLVVKKLHTQSLSSTAAHVYIRIESSKVTWCLQGQAPRNWPLDRDACQTRGARQCLVLPSLAERVRSSKCERRLGRAWTLQWTRPRASVYQWSGCVGDSNHLPF